ncbi:UNVERIFIED_CONTAM: hypothetical protein K2H54_053855 [Gekko kuhli]
MSTCCWSSAKLREARCGPSCVKLWAKLHEARYFFEPVAVFCGTPEYLVPEILRHKRHDYAVDFWMLGVLIFEMIVGRPPFHSPEPQNTYGKILDGVFSFPVFSYPYVNFRRYSVLGQVPKEEFSGWAVDF